MGSGEKPRIVYATTLPAAIVTETGSLFSVPAQVPSHESLDAAWATAPFTSMNAAHAIICRNLNVSLPFVERPSAIATCVRDNRPQWLSRAIPVQRVTKPPTKNEMANL